MLAGRLWGSQDKAEREARQGSSSCSNRLGHTCRGVGSKTERGIRSKELPRVGRCNVRCQHWRQDGK